jgi:hypothetical protein
MGGFIRWVVMPVAVLALGATWSWFRFVDRVQENCGQDCVTARQVATWGWAFWIALALWLLVVVTHVWRRRRRRREGLVRLD